MIYNNYNPERQMSVSGKFGEIKFHFSDEGCVCIDNPRTLNRYHEVSNQQYDFTGKAGFFAFSQKQYEEGRDRLLASGIIQSADELCSWGYGFIATESCYDEFIAFGENRDKVIAAECDAQEVYFYEYNNHESMISWGGDSAAFDVIERIFSAKDVASVERIF